MAIPDAAGIPSAIVKKNPIQKKSPRCGASCSEANNMSRNARPRPAT
jgi:hypothetical protein